MTSDTATSDTATSGTAQARTPGARTPLWPALAQATETLRAAGVHSPRADAEYLAAHVLGVQRTRLALLPSLTAEQLSHFTELVVRRAKRIPLQYLTGTAVMGDIDVAVGPGVFVPRPETELLFAWALGQLATRRQRDTAVVVDLCTGSGALALAIAHARPDVVVHAVEHDPDAARWARRNADTQRNAGDTPIALHQGDVTDPGVLSDLNDAVDLIVANPPYVPTQRRASDTGLSELDPEVFAHDPHVALFGGADGLAVITPMIATIARLLRAGAVAAVEHDESHGAQVAQLFSVTGQFTAIMEHPDLSGRPRFVAARKATGAAPAGS